MLAAWADPGARRDGPNEADPDVPAKLLEQGSERDEEAEALAGRDRKAWKPITAGHPGPSPEVDPGVPGRRAPAGDGGEADPPGATRGRSGSFGGALRGASLRPPAEIAQGTFV